MAARRFKLLQVAAWRFKLLLDAAIGASAVGTLHAAKRMDRKRSANMAGALMRKIGPRRREHRLGRDNLHAAFPDKSDAEIETILAGVWDNLGRVAAEFAHLDEFQIEGLGPSTPDTVRLSPETLERAARIKKAEKPAIGFACHLANWEISALAAKLYGAKSAVLYRRPNIAAVGDVVTRLREPLMGELVRAGLEVHVFNHRSVADILRMIRTLGGMIGCEDKAHALAASLEAGLAQVRARAAAFTRRPRVYFEEWDDPLISGIRWVSELVTLAGGEECFPELAREALGRNRIIADPLEVPRRAPDVVLASWCGKKFRPQSLAARPGWDAIPAVRTGYVREIKSSIILQPGPAALTDGVRAIQAILAEWVDAGAGA
jgi:iron complex transport system substrate-binding protein